MLVTTPDDAPTVLGVYATVADTVVTITLTVGASCPGTGAVGSYVRVGCFKRVGGTLTHVGTSSPTSLGAAWDVTFDGTDARFLVTGEAVEDVHWTGHVTAVVAPL